MVSVLTVVVALNTVLHWYAYTTNDIALQSLMCTTDYPCTSYTRELSGAWSATRSVLSSCWAAVYRATGENDMVVYLVVFPLVTNVVFVFVNSFFAVLDLTGKPAFLVKYKIQEAKTVPVSVHVFMRVA